MFKQDRNYPTWNPKNTEDKPATPNWTSSFGDIKISFQEGSKSCYVNKKKFQKKNVLCGDYTIHVTIPEKVDEEKITDKKFIEIIKKDTKCEIDKLATIAQSNFENYLIEEKLVSSLTSNPDLTDLCKAFLYYAWHRCIIEERLYQQPYYGGSQTFLKIIK